jgi:hypothetical protein
LWERKDILAFCLAFPLECKTSKEKLKYWFFIFGYPFSFSIGDALICNWLFIANDRGHKSNAVGMNLL